MLKKLFLIHRSNLYVVCAFGLPHVLFPKKEILGSTLLAIFTLPQMRKKSNHPKLEGWIKRISLEQEHVICRPWLEAW